MSLGAIDFGLVVDSSVIMVENAAKRLDEDKSGRSIRDIVRDAAVEVRKPDPLRGAHHRHRVSADPRARGRRGEALPPHGAHGDLRAGGLHDPVVTLMPVLASYALRSGRSTQVNRDGALAQTQATAAARLGAREPSHRPGARRARGAERGFPRHAARLGVRAAAREQAIVINTVRIGGVSLDESVRYGTHIERFLLERSQRDRARLDPHGHRRGRDRSDGPGGLGRLHHAEAARRVERRTSGRRARR
jgi:cobalt-zinc-cadmium resistance protein CzcA